MAQSFDAAQLKELGDNYTFYQYKGLEGEKLQGQFFAIKNDQEPEQKGEQFIFEAVVKILNQPNSAVRVATMDSETINDSFQVRGANAAQTVSKTHPSLVRFLLKQADSAAVA